MVAFIPDKIGTMREKKKCLSTFSPFPTIPSSQGSLKSGFCDKGFTLLGQGYASKQVFSKSHWTVTVA